MPIHMDFLLVLRWMGILALVVFVARRGSLTAWILVSMVVGAEIEEDLPCFERDLQHMVTKERG